jgi:hypothetical protein
VLLPFVAFRISSAISPGCDTSDAWLALSEIVVVAFIHSAKLRWVSGGIMLDETGLGLCTQKSSAIGNQESFQKLCDVKEICHGLTLIGDKGANVNKACDVWILVSSVRYYRNPPYECPTRTVHPF